MIPILAFKLNRIYFKCLDIDECAQRDGSADQHQCPPNSLGVLFEKLYLYTVGSAIDFSFRHPHFSHCVNQEATYECECDEGYQETAPYVDAASYECTNIDECAANPCPPNSQEYFHIIVLLDILVI